MGSTALAGFGATLYLFWPGFMTWDSTEQLSQVVSGRVENPHPPIMVYLWMVTHSVIRGSAGMLVVHAATYWSGLACAAAAATASPVRRAALLLLLGFFPPTFGLLPTVWKDIGFLGFGLLGVGLLLVAGPQRRPGRIVGALACTFYACAVRPPGWLAVLPILWLAARELAPGGMDAAAAASPLSRPRRLAFPLAIWALLAALFAAGTFAVSNVGVVRLPYRAMVPIWDLAWISLQRNELLIPPYAIHREPFDLERLRHITRPYRGNFHAKEDRLMSTPDLDYRYLSDEQANQVIIHWLRTVGRYPHEYLHHRTRVTRALFGNPSGKLAHRIQWIPAFTPNVEFHRRPGYQQVVDFLFRASRTLLYEPLLYVGLGLGVFALSFAARQRLARFARAVALSGLLSVAPLPVIAPSPDFRYSVWCIAASVLGLALLVAALARRRDECVPAVGEVHRVIPAHRKEEAGVSAGR